MRTLSFDADLAYLEVPIQWYRIVLFGDAVTKLKLSRNPLTLSGGGQCVTEVCLSYLMDVGDHLPLTIPS